MGVMRTMSRTFSALLKVVMPLKPRHQPWSMAYCASPGPEVKL